MHKNHWNQSLEVSKGKVLPPSYTSWMAWMVLTHLTEIPIELENRPFPSNGVENIRIGCCAQNRPIVFFGGSTIYYSSLPPGPVGISQRTICCCLGLSSFLAFLTVCGKFLPFAWFCDDGVSGLTSMNFYLTRSDVTNRGPLHDEPSKAGPDGELMNLSLSC